MIGIFISKNSIAQYCIVVPDDAMKSELYAAEELKKYIARSSGDDLNIVKESECNEENLIYIGRCKASAELIDFCELGEEGFVITTKEDKLYISGNEKRGTLYGVYTFLEKYIGWRFFTTDTEMIFYERDAHIENGIYDKQIPVLEWRDVCIPTYLPCDIAVKRKINSSYRRDFTEEMGGSFLYPGRFVHTMESLLDVPQLQQPCFSDEKNLEKCIANVKTLLRGYPDARVISVTQNDCEIGDDCYCKCEKCQKIDEEEGSHAGSLLRFVNAVADAIKDEFPNVRIMTLAYLHTVNCPKITVPRDNVIIEFAPMTLCYNHSADDESCEINKDILADFRAWNKIAKKIYIWDYCANFSFTVPHFPDFHVLRKNINYYVKNKVCGMFCEGDNYYDDHMTDLVELRAYLLSKLLWEPEMTEEEFDTHMDEFLLGYYGKGGKYVKDYLKLLQEAVGDERHVYCYQNPTMLVDVDYMLNNDDKMMECWKKCEAMAETETEKAHVHRSMQGYIHLHLLYTFDERFKNADEEGKKALIAENKAFYEALQKYEIEPRGWQSKLPEITDFTQNAGVKIYW